KWLAEGLAFFRVLDAFVDAILRCAERGRRLPDTILVHEVLRDFQPVFRIAERRITGYVHIRERNSRMVGRHVEGPEIFLDFESLALHRNDKAGDARGAAVTSAGAGEHEVMGCDVQARVPDFRAVDAPAVTFADGARFHPGGVGTVTRFGQTEGDA